MWSLKIVYLRPGKEVSVSNNVSCHPESRVAAGDSPLLELDLARIRTSLGSDEFLQVPDRIVWAALDSDWIVAISMG